MATNKVIFNDETLIDLTGNTVTADTLLEGVTATNAAGEQIVGAYTPPDLSNYVTVEEFNKLKSRIGRCGGFYT